MHSGDETRVFVYYGPVLLHTCSSSRGTSAVVKLHLAWYNHVEEVCSTTIARRFPQLIPRHEVHHLQPGLLQALPPTLQHPS